MPFESQGSSRAAEQPIKELYHFFTKRAVPTKVKSNRVKTVRNHGAGVMGNQFTNIFFGSYFFLIC